MSKPDVLIANHHSAPIVFRRPAAAGETLTSTRVLLPAITIYPGTTELVPAEVWEDQKEKPAIQAMLDAGVITVEREKKDVPIAFDSAASDPPIPEHLQTEEFEAEESPIKTRIAKARAGTVAI